MKMADKTFFIADSGAKNAFFKNENQHPGNLFFSHYYEQCDDGKEAFYLNT